MNFTEEQTKIIQVLATHVGCQLDIDFHQPKNYEVLIRAIIETGWEDLKYHTTINMIEFQRFEIARLKVEKSVFFSANQYSGKRNVGFINEVRRHYEKQIMNLSCRLRAMESL